MSLFKVKDWWSVKCGSDEEFDHNSLCIANIDNNPNGSGLPLSSTFAFNPVLYCFVYPSDNMLLESNDYIIKYHYSNADKIIVGSHNGILRIFSVSAGTADDGSLFEYQASDLLMEVDFKMPILQVLAGLLLSATTNIQLAVLYPKKLSIYSISSTAGVTEHGSAYNILLIYEHILQRSAFNMTIGPFGQVKGKDFLCVQSLDGNLSFYEQESLAFNRFIPNALIAGPLAYVAHSDSFIVASSSWTIESYRYQLLAIAKNDENSLDKSAKGRKVSPDWSVTIGESVVDMKVIFLDKSISFIIILGERNLFTLKENGTIGFMKKFDINPSCLHAYPNETNDSIMQLVATHENTLLIYCNDILKWATQLPFTPVSIQRAYFPNLSGPIVCLSDEGHLCCGYLGTNPSIKIVPVPTTHANTTNYADTELELKELRKIINAHNFDGPKAIDTTESAKDMRDISIGVHNIQTLSALNGKISVNPLIKLSVQLESHTNISNVRLTVDSHESLNAEPNFVVIPSINTAEPCITDIIISKESQIFPSSTKISFLVAYMNEDGAPRVVSKSIFIPINIFVKLVTATKEAEHRLTFDIITNGETHMNLSELFSDLYNSESPNRNAIAINMSNNSTAIGLEIYDNYNIVTIITSIRSLNQKFIVTSDSFGALAFIANELLRRLRRNDVKYDTSDIDKTFIPLNKVYSLIDEHLSARHLVIDLQNHLSNFTSQYRAIQKRLLIKLKDRNPTSLSNLDTLLKVTQNQISNYGDKLIKAIVDLNKKTSHLNSAMNLIHNLITIAIDAKSILIKNVWSIFANNISFALEEGWEERTELALILLLDSHANDTKFSEELTISENTDNLKRLINQLMDRLFQIDSGNQREINTYRIEKNEAILEDDEISDLNYEQSDSQLQINVN